MPENFLRSLLNALSLNTGQAHYKPQTKHCPLPRVKESCAVDASTYPGASSLVHRACGQNGKSEGRFQITPAQA